MDELTRLNKKLVVQRQAIEDQKQQTIQALTMQVKSLEQALINSNMEIAQSKAQLEVETQIVAKLKQEQDSLLPQEGELRIERTANMFGGFFKGWSKQPEKSSSDKQSKLTEEANVNYAKYLF